MENDFRLKKGSSKRADGREPCSANITLAPPYDVAANMRVGAPNETWRVDESKLVANGNED